MGGHVHVNDAPAVVGQDDEDRQHAKRRGRDREEIDRGELRGMSAKKRAPRRRRRRASPVEILRDCRFGDVEAKFEQFTMDAWGTPERIGSAHLANENAEIGRDRRAAHAARS